MKRQSDRWILDVPEKIILQGTKKRERRKFLVQFIILSSLLSLKRGQQEKQRLSKVATVIRTSAIRRSGHKNITIDYRKNQRKELTTGLTNTSKPLDTVYTQSGNPVKMHWKFKDNHTLGKFFPRS